MAGATGEEQIPGSRLRRPPERPGVPAVRVDPIERWRNPGFFDTATPPSGRTRGVVQSCSTVVSEANMKLLQLHEYLRFLHAGTGRHQLSQSELDRCMSAAQEIWPDTGLLPWESAPRTVAYAWKSNDGCHIGTHITADKKACFLILAMSEERASSYIVFDIGAEYSEPEYICPLI